MIVVLAAGIAANLTLNPFEAMTTITVKIVNQLTGDLEFNSPQTLVAFALGLTLFVFTLCMNICRALHRAQIPGAVRMTDMLHAITAAAGAARQPRRDIGIKRRYAAERRFRALRHRWRSRSASPSWRSCCSPIVSQGLHRLLADRRCTLPVNFDEKSSIPDNKRATDPNVLIAANYPVLAARRAGRPSSASTPTTSRRCAS